MIRLYRCDELRAKIKLITDGEYSASKHEVDKLRQELGQEPLPSLQQMLDEKSAALSIQMIDYLVASKSDIKTKIKRYLKGRRLNAAGELASTTNKKRTSVTPRPDESLTPSGSNGPNHIETPAKRPRGRPRGSRNKIKSADMVEDDT